MCVFSFLAGDGVRQWALNEGLDAVEERTTAGTLHVTEDSLKRWREYRELIESTPPPLNGQPPAKFSRTLNDTVGCVVVNAAGQLLSHSFCVLASTKPSIHIGEVCSGVSSGGIAMKAPGRVGEAAIYGAGCWAQNAERRNESSIACSVSGVGEVVIRGFIARSCAESLTKDTPLDAIKDTIESHTAELGEPKDVGVISVRTSTVRKKGHQEKHVELCVVHNAWSMGFSYLMANSRPATRFLRHGDHNDDSIAEFGACVKWPMDETADK